MALPFQTALTLQVTTVSVAQLSVPANGCMPSSVRGTSQFNNLLASP